MRAALRGTLVAALSALAVAPALAGSFSANPVRLVLGANVASTAVTIDNQADEPVLIQAEVMGWQQVSGHDELNPSQDLVVSPPIFRVAAGGSQIVRIGLLRRVDPSTELAYRIFLKEVPAPPAQGDSQIRVALRLGLPLFVSPSATARPAWTWRVHRGAAGGLEVDAGNVGRAHGQLIDVRLLSPQGLTVGQRRGGDYVLPGQSRRLLFENRGDVWPDRVRIVAETDAGAVSADVPLE